MIWNLNSIHISLKHRSNNFLVDAGTGLLQIWQSWADNGEAHQSRTLTLHKLWDKLTTGSSIFTGTSASLCFFRKKSRIRQQEVENAITLKLQKVETWNFERRWSTYVSFLVQILEAIIYVIQVSEPKTEMPIGGLNSSTSKTNRMRRIKVSNLEACGHAVSAPKNKPWRFRHLCFSLRLPYDASRRKSLCFSGKNYEFNKEVKNAITLKRLKLETSYLELRWGTYKSFFVQIFEAIGYVIRVSEPKTETLIGGLNSSSSKSNRTRRIKVSNLEACGHAVSAPKNKSWRFRHFFFLYLFV